MKSIIPYIITYLAGIVTPLFIEYLRKKLFDKILLKTQIRHYISSDMSFLCIKIVNVSDVPAVLQEPVITIGRGPFERLPFLITEILEEELGKEVDDDYPIKLLRNEIHEKYIEAVPLLKLYIRGRTQDPHVKTELSLDRIEIKFNVDDSTGRRWKSNSICFSETEITLLNKAINDDPALIQYSADELGL